MLGDFSPLLDFQPGCDSRQASCAESTGDLCRGKAAGV